MRCRYTIMLLRCLNYSKEAVMKRFTSMKYKHVNFMLRCQVQLSLLRCVNQNRVVSASWRPFSSTYLYLVPLVWHLFLLSFCRTLYLPKKFETVQPCGEGTPFLHSFSIGNRQPHKAMFSLLVEYLWGPHLRKYAIL